MAENPPKIFQFLWQSLQELLKIDPEGLLEASFDQYLIQARCQTFKNRVRSAQERPQEVHGHAKPFQNGAQDTPTSSSGAILEPCFCHSKFISFLHGLFLDFLLIFQRPTLTKHCVGARILKNAVFQENLKNLLKSSEFFPEILPKSMKNR